MCCSMAHLAQDVEAALAALAKTPLTVQGQPLTRFSCRRLKALSAAGSCGHQSSNKEDIQRYHSFVRALPLRQEARCVLSCLHRSLKS